MGRLRKLDTRIYFAATRVPFGELVLLRLHHGDIYDIFRACLAVPGCYPTTVRVGKDDFVDGGTVNPLPASFLPNQNILFQIAIVDLRQNLDMG